MLDNDEIPEVPNPEQRSESPTPHLDKLTELRKNPKLPAADRERVEKAIARYHGWTREMDEIMLRPDLGPDDRVRVLVDSLNRYKSFVELEVIWDSTEDFLHRQRGQLKIDSSILEEFLPRLIHSSVIPPLEGRVYVAGPRTVFSAAYFTTTLAIHAEGAGLQIRTKDHDFTVGRPAFLRASFQADFPAADTVTHNVYLAFVAAECKTNLDKTMFQEAAATAHDLKVAMPGARYYLLCEWLDMTPISTAATDIDEVVILRGKRLPSNVRANHASYAGRQARRAEYATYLDRYPIRNDMVLRFVNHMRALFGIGEPEEPDVLIRGYF